MAITLADVNAQLVKQNELQEEQNNLSAAQVGAIAGMASGLSSLIDTFKSDQMDQLEADREKRAEERRVVKSTTPKADNKKGLFDFLPEGGLFGLGAGLAKFLPKFLLGRALPALLAKMFADEIADYVESATGSKDLGDAIYRGLNLGALGLLVSRKLGIVGFFAGALLTSENRQKLETLGGSLTELGTKIGQFFDPEFGLPSFDQAFKFVTETFGRALDFLISGTSYITNLMKDDKTEEDLKKMDQDLDILGDNWDDFGIAIAGLAVMFKPFGTVSLILKAIAAPFKMAYKGLKGLAGLVLGGTAIKEFGKTQMGEMSKGELQKMNTKQIQGMSADDIKKLEGEGYKVNQKTGAVTNLKGQAVSADQVRGSMSRLGMENPLNQAAAKKYSRFGKLLKVGKSIPFLGSLLSAGYLGAILLSDASDEEKIKTIGGLFGGVAGSLALAGIGSLAGPFGTIAGAIGGGLAGDQLGQWFAGWLMNNNGKQAGTESVGDYGEFGNLGNDLSAPTSQASAPYAPMSGTILRDVADQSVAMQNTSGGVNMLDTSDKSITVNNSSGVTMAGPMGTPFDTYNKYVLYA